MENFLKKLETENFRMRYLKFSEINSLDSLKKFTRIKSFVLNGQFEISTTKWWFLYLCVVEKLQQIRNLDKNYLLNLSSFTGRCKPFSESYKDGYVRTDFGLYLRKPGSTNNIVFALMRMIGIFSFNLDDAYLIVELTPDEMSYYADEIVETEKKDLYLYLNNIYIHAKEYFDLSIKAIEELNHTLCYFSTTTYNNLYLLSSIDYWRYANEAIEKQLGRNTNSFTRSELTQVIIWLYNSRFLDGDYLNSKYKTSDDCYIRDGEKRIQVTFKSHSFGGDNHEN